MTTPLKNTPRFACCSPPKMGRACFSFPWVGRRPIETPYGRGSNSVLFGAAHVSKRLRRRQ